MSALAKAGIALLLLAQDAPAETSPRSTPGRGMQGDRAVRRPVDRPIDQPIVLNGRQDLQLAPPTPAPLPTDADIARVQIQPDLLRLVRAFDSDSFAERASARDAIAARSPSSLELMAILLRKDLSLDARHALVTLLSDAIMHAPRGALGIRMDGPLMRETPGVRVTALVPGMPAERVLQPGDLLREIEGKPLIDRTELIRTVQSLAPGVEVQLLVRRVRRDAEGRVLTGPDGAELTDDLRVRVRLGSTDDLETDGEPAGNVANPLVAERAAQVAEAQRRFLPAAATVAFPAREEEAPKKSAVSVELLRRQLAAMQLAGVDPELLRPLRARVDLADKTLRGSSDHAQRSSAQAELEALAVEIRRIRGS